MNEEKSLSINKKFKQCVARTKKGVRCKIITKNPNNHCTRHQNRCKPIHMLDRPEECPICFESTKNIKCPLECGHWVHIECIEQSIKTECPMCRHTLKNLPKNVCNKITKNKRKHNEQVLAEQRQELFNMILQEYIDHIISNGGEITDDGIIISSGEHVWKRRRPLSRRKNQNPQGSLILTVPI